MPYIIGQAVELIRLTLQGNRVTGTISAIPTDSESDYEVDWLTKGRLLQAERDLRPVGGYRIGELVDARYQLFGSTKHLVGMVEDYDQELVRVHFGQQHGMVRLSEDQISPNTSLGRSPRPLGIREVRSETFVKLFNQAILEDNTCDIN